MSGVFSEQILADKLTKLNNTQQCIETLSHWCIFHRKDAEKIIQTWDKQFHNSDKERRIPFLYLANDILQNSKKNGKEFVEEFWKVLPSALREMSSTGDDRAKNVVSRLVDIWEERRVFGSRPKGLKDLMLGDEPLPKLELNKKRSRTDIKIVRRDSRSVRIKLSIGGTAEKIISAFNAVLNEEIDEDSDLEKCKLAIKRVVNLEKDVENASNQVGETCKETLSTDLKAEENSLRKCVERLKAVESSRAKLVSQLKEALKEQESELEKVRTQIQLAAATKDQVANLQRRLNNEPILTNNSKLKKKSSAAEVADRLAASSHSTQIMSSVLSSFIENTNTNNNTNNNNTNNNNNNNNNNTNNNSNSNVSSGSNTGVYMIGMPYGYGGPPPPPPPAVVVVPPVPATAPATLAYVRPIMPPQPPNIGLVPINGQMMPVNQQNPGLQNPGLQFGHPPGFRMPFYPPPS